MGCDIHVYIEQQRLQDDKWVNLDYFRNYESEGYRIVPIYDGRNYTLFSILADVRNCGKNDPIAKPKGMPDDCCDVIKEEYRGWEGDAHSTSYFTLGELRKYKRTHLTVKYRGMISPIQIKKLEEDGMYPQSWCQSTNMEGYEFREWEKPNNELDDLIEAIEERIKCENYIWGRNDSEIEEKLKMFEDRVRIVFWFDN